MKTSDFPKTVLCALAVVFFCAGPSVTQANSEPDATQRVFVVREGAVASLLNGDFKFKLLKINGYSIKVKISGQVRLLSLGQSFSPEGAACSVNFTEIASETRIARFSTDCA